MPSRWDLAAPALSESLRLSSACLQDASLMAQFSVEGNKLKISASLEK